MLRIYSVTEVADESFFFDLNFIYVLWKNTGLLQLNQTNLVVISSNVVIDVLPMLHFISWGFFHFLFLVFLKFSFFTFVKI